MVQYLSQLGNLHAASSVVCTGVAREVLLPEYSQSLCSTPTSCLAFLPILPAWPISVLLKYMIDRIQIILPHHFPLFFFFKTKANTHSPFVGNVGVVFQATSCWLGALIVLRGPKENLEL